VAVDLLSGALAAERAAPGLTRLALGPEGEELALDLADGLQRWHFSGSDFLPEGLPAKVEPALSALAFGPEGLYTADREGSLSLVDETGARRLLARNVILPVGGLDFRGAAAALSTPEGIFVLRSPVLDGSQGDVEQLSLNRLPPPFPGSFKLQFLDDRRLLAWREEPGALATVDLATGESQAMAVAIGSSLQQVSLSPHGLILVERSGLCRILDPQSLQTRFSYAARAVNRLTPTRGDLLVGAGAAGFGSSLFQINSRTGETVPIRDPSLFVYDLLYSTSRATLYSLAVESSSGSARTVLAAHTGRQLDSRRVLATFEGEDLRASLAEDAEGRLYCSLGFGPLAVWDGTTLARRENPGAVARRLAVHAGRLYAVNTDSSISVWDSPGEAPWRMYLFLDGDWALLGPQGQVYGSPGARRYLADQGASRRANGRQ
jgi:hypothetical protein